MSLKIKVYNQSAEPKKDLALSENIFAISPSSDLLHQALVAQNNNSRQVLAHTKDRSEVAGGGKKPWKQKGTGRARAGSSRSPIWIGGGVTFGPRKDNNFKQKINQKMKQKAIFMALSDRVENKNFVALEDLKLKEYKTKEINEVISNFEKKIFKSDRRSFLLVKEEKDDKLKYSVRNLPGVKLINVSNINLADLLNHRYLIMTEKAISALSERYNK